MFKRITREMDSYFTRDPAARTRLEIFFCYPGFHAMMWFRLTHWLWERNLRTLARFLSQMGRLLTGVEIHPGAQIGERLFIDHGMGVVIGETAIIGNDVTIYHGVTLGGTSTKPGPRHPNIGDNVIIGSGAQILGPITVGSGARIGSNAVVVKDVEENATMVGVPARKVEQKVVPLKEEPIFTSYGVNDENLIDPRQQAIDAMLREMHELKTRVQELEGSSESAERWETKKSKKKKGEG